MVTTRSKNASRRRPLHRLLHAALLGAAAGCWPGPTDGELDLQRLVVLVREPPSAGGAGIASVELALRSLDPLPGAPPLARALTNAEGRAIFDDQLGSMALWVTVPAGYALAAGQGNPVVVELRDGRSDDAEVTIVLQRIE